jgi:hypothetical protein
VAARLPEVVICLHLDPHLGARTQRSFQSKGHLGTDSGPAIQESRQGLARNSQPTGNLADRQTPREELAQDFSGVRWVMHLSHRRIPQW